MKKWWWIAVLALLSAPLIWNYHPEQPVEDLRAAYTYPESDFTEIMGIPVHYRRLGEGSVLLLLHGTGATLHTWEGWTAELQDSFEVISVTLPAFGLTGPRPDGDYSIPAYVDFVEAFAKKLGLKQFHLAGNSLGGLIAWEYALRYPERVQKLVLLNASGWPRDQEMPLAMRLARKPVFRQLLQRITPKALFRKSLQEVYANPDRISDTLVDRYFDLFLREGNRRAYVQRLNQSYQPDPHQLSELNIPTFILWGEQDAWIPVADAYRFDEVLPNSQLLIYPDAGHVPMEEWPARTAEDIRSFLR
ncbi:MAG: alpha/beta hydrolase [Phaeodactylibacter sp.]|uniref:alpha/beta fold hydrolase n=1 Tax=Phaeodactylibacter sp. TaxID=1940289 RepID=UPI0032EEDCD3